MVDFDIEKLLCAHGFVDSSRDTACAACDLKNGCRERTAVRTRSRIEIKVVPLLEMSRGCTIFRVIGTLVFKISHFKCALLATAVGRERCVVGCREEKSKLFLSLKTPRAHRGRTNRYASFRDMACAACDSENCCRERTAVRTRSCIESKVV